MRAVASLERTQWWSRERIEELQARRLLQLLEHAYAHVPYYQELLHTLGLDASDFRSVAGLSKLPLLTKDIIRDRVDDLAADGFPPGQIMTGSTSGSTGDPLSFRTSREAWFDHGYAREVRSLSWAGISLGDRVVAVRSTVGANARRERALRPLINRFQRMTVFSASDIDDRTVSLITQELRHRDTRALLACPSVLSLIATHLKNTGTAIPGNLRLLADGEHLFEHERKLSKDVFGAEPCSRYASWENYEMASECLMHNGLHVDAEDLVLEIVDSDGRPVSTGQSGHIVVTNLHSFAMPFIRYDTGDIGSLSDEPCPCGRGLPLLTVLQGRNSGFIQTRSGRHIPGSAFRFDKLARLRITQYQMTQHDLDSITLSVVHPTSITIAEQEALSNSIGKILHECLDNEVHQKVQFVTSIEPTAEGKYVSVISTVDSAAAGRQVKETA